MLLDKRRTERAVPVPGVTLRLVFYRKRWNLRRNSAVLALISTIVILLILLTRYRNPNVICLKRRCLTVRVKPVVLVQDLMESGMLTSQKGVDDIAFLFLYF
jgi:hypothetical protein